MARISQLTERNDLPETDRHIFDSIASTRGKVAGPFAMLLHSPEIANRTASLGEYIRFNSGLSGEIRELLIITVARELNCNFEWSAHEPLARKNGVRDEAITIVANSGELDQLTFDEAILVDYARQLCRANKVSQEAFEKTQEKYGDRGITEITATLAYYIMLANILNAFEVEQPTGTPVLPYIKK